jgi:hypothetical protein
MNNILENLFYKEKLGIGNKTTFIKNVRERHPDIKLKDILDARKQGERITTFWTLQMRKAS